MEGVRPRPGASHWGWAGRDVAGPEARGRGERPLDAIRDRPLLFDCFLNLVWGGGTEWEVRFDEELEPAEKATSLLMSALFLSVG